MESPNKINVAILGATGTVGQRFIQLLADHPVFRVAALGASSNSAGKIYSDAVHWLLPTLIPADIASMKYQRCSVVFSALDSNVATEIESRFRESGKAVFSNAKNHRYDDDVPILVASVNPEHAAIIARQQQNENNKGGYIITNPNCSTTGIVVALKPIHLAYGIDEVVAFTMQSVSGAGYPGVPSLDILGNVIPYIGDEEEKIEIETKKILGSLCEKQHSFVDDTMMVSAHTNRVGVVEGHTICLSIKLKKSPESIQEVKDVLKSYYPKELNGLVMPSMRGPPIAVLEECNRPQPKLDVTRDNGFTVSVGRVRGGSTTASGSSFDLRLTLLVHNTVLGAAGSSIQNAEYCYAKGLISSKQ
eukprot:gene3644-4184_t